MTLFDSLLSNYVKESSESNKFVFKSCNIIIKTNICEIHSSFEIYHDVDNSQLPTLAGEFGRSLQEHLQVLFPYYVGFTHFNNEFNLSVSFSILDPIFEELTQITDSIKTKKDLSIKVLGGEISPELAQIYKNLLIKTE